MLGLHYAHVALPARLPGMATADVYQPVSDEQQTFLNRACPFDAMLRVTAAPVRFLCGRCVPHSFLIPSACDCIIVRLGVFGLGRR